MAKNDIPCSSYPQLSKHSADQRESVLPAALHQRHSEDLPEGGQRVGLSQRHRLLHYRLPLPRPTHKQLQYDTLYFLPSLILIMRTGTVVNWPDMHNNYKRDLPTLTICPNYLPSPQICGCRPCWMTGSCLRGPCLTTAPTVRPSWRFEFTQDKRSATECLSMSMWAMLHTSTTRFTFKCLGYFNASLTCMPVFVVGHSRLHPSNKLLAAV